MSWASTSPGPIRSASSSSRPTPWSFTLKRLDRGLGIERRTHALASWPAGEFSGYRLHSPMPLVPIDHVYAGRDWRTVSVKRGPKLGSDHYPVVVTLRLGDEPQKKN